MEVKLMIAVVAGITVKEGRFADYVACAKKIVAETRKENGCIAYEFCQSAGEPLRCAMIEKWESRAALDAHMQTAHFKEFGASTESLIAAPLSVDIYDIVL